MVFSLFCCAHQHEVCCQVGGTCPSCGCRLKIGLICRKALQLLRHVLIENPDDARAACSQGLLTLVASLVNTADNDVRLVALLLASQLIIDAGAAQRFQKVGSCCSIVEYYI